MVLLSKLIPSSTTASLKPVHRYHLHVLSRNEINQLDIVHSNYLYPRTVLVRENTVPLYKLKIMNTNSEDYEFILNCIFLVCSETYQHLTEQLILLFHSQHSPLSHVLLEFNAVTDYFEYISHVRHF